MDNKSHNPSKAHPGDHMFTRRDILKIGSLSIVCASALSPVLAHGAGQPLIIMDQAKGVVMADSAACMGCGRCERACTEFNEGKASPTLSRIKIERNTNLGIDTSFLYREGRGIYGSGSVVQNLCKQCPHPVPCADICPENAIVTAPSTGARMVDTSKCTGCKICLKVCPWEMISFDPDSRKATKCHLCNGRPKCVEACPTGSLSFIPWRDLRGETPARVLVTAKPSADRGSACFECHLPGWKSAHAGMGLPRGRSKAPRSSLTRQSAFGWIDRLGTLFLPVVVLGVIVHGALRAMVKR